ncbi:MAG: esterase-like activity of phytase family protein [Rhodospirillales bacterium]|nr:esterase-like activity of phytase family protein [Rhodospirillales bacterium]
MSGPSLARTVAAGVVLGAVVLASGAALAASISLSTRQIALDPNDRTVQHIGKLQFLGGLAVRSDAPAFGGLSGLCVTADGRLAAVSDRGHWFTVRIVRNDAGRLVGLADAELGSLKDQKGRPVEDEWRDAEALERLPNGDWLVSFERAHRVWRYPVETGGLQGRPTPHQAPKAIARAPANGGIEALTPLADGRILMLAQGLKREDGARAGWLVGEGGIEALGYRTAPRFLPTDAATLPGGDVLVLARHYSVLGGARARLERVPAETIKAGATLRGALVARFQHPLTVDNFEGVAVVQGEDGSTLVYILSDDNFNFFQRTLLLLFRLRGS